MEIERDYNVIPDPLAPFEDKLSEEYGLKIAQEIGRYWFGDGIISGDCFFNERRQWIREKRAYAKGKQNVKQYQNNLAGKDVKLSYLNLDWRPLNIAGKFVRLVVNGMKEDKLYRLNINAIDRAAAVERENKVDELKKNMVSLKMLKDAKKRFNIDLTPKSYVPMNEEELELYSQMNSKLKIEIAQEMLQRAVRKMNRYDTIKERVGYDLTECGLGAMECYTDKTEGIKYRWIDIENLVHSFVKENDFDDCYYYGEVVTKTIGDIKRESDFTDNQLRTIAYKYHSKNNKDIIYGFNYTSVAISEILDYEIDVLRFSYKTSKEKVYKKKKNKVGEGFRMTKKDAKYNPPEGAEHKRVSKTLDTWLEGYHIVGSKFLYNYQEAENIQNDKMNRAKSSFIVRATGIYNNQLFSFIDDIEPIIDEMQRIHLKIQQVISEIRPSGVEIDWDMMVNLSTGGEGGAALDHKDVLSLFAAKGIVFKKRYRDEDGNMTQGRAVESIQNGIPSNLNQLTGSWGFYYNLIRDIIGINSFRDGTQPHDALVGVQKQALQQSNLSTEHISKAAIDLTVRLAEVTSTRMRDIFKWSDIKSIYIKAIGEINMNIIEETKDIHLHEFGFEIELLPTEEEFMNFQESLNLALKKNEITSADLIDVKTLYQSSPKLASQFLRYRIKKNLEYAEQSKQRDMQMKSQLDAQSAQVASQARIKEEKERAKIEVEKQRELTMLEINKEAALIRVKQPTEDKKLAADIYQSQLEAQNMVELTKYKEEKKDERQDRKDTNASKLIEQRKKDTGSIDFSSDDIDINKALELLNNAVA
ncbi:hypothetical protein [Galbibacter sp. BG1]